MIVEPALIDCCTGLTWVKSDACASGCTALSVTN